MLFQYEKKLAAVMALAAVVSAIQLQSSVYGRVLREKNKRNPQGTRAMSSGEGLALL